MSEEFKLPRTGLVPIKFRGDVLVQNDGRLLGLEEDKIENKADIPGNVRYHVLTVYKTTHGKFILSIHYITHWRKEMDHRYADAFTTLGEVAIALGKYNPTQHVQGYPPGEAHEDKQARMLADVQAHYLEQVGSVLMQLEDVAKEVA